VPAFVGLSSSGLAPQRPKALGPDDDGTMKAESRSRTASIPSQPLPLLVRFGKGPRQPPQNTARILELP